MTTIPVVVAGLGWLSSVALAVVLSRGRRATLAHAAHLARVAHELRGPLHAAGLVLHSVRRHTQDEAAIRALAALEVELGRVALATGDLQADRGPARVCASDRARATCDVVALVADLAPGWATLAEAHGRRLRTTVPHGALWVGGERLRLAQALGNLVGNALEHGAGEVNVVVGATRQGPVQVEVRDEGPGLPASVATLVARPRAADAPRGLGLTIAAAIAADVGGRLAAAPAVSGSRLVLRLPAASPPAAPGVDNPAGGPTVGPRRATCLPTSPTRPTRPLAS